MSPKSFALAIALALGCAGAAVAHAASAAVDYSGSWKLDVARSRNLPSYYSGIRSHRLVTRQDASSLQVQVQLDKGDDAPQSFTFRYLLDGTPVASSSKIRTPTGMEDVPTTLRALVDEAGQLRITATTQRQQRDAMAEGVTTEHWRLSADGATLTVRRAAMGLAGLQESDLVFAKEQ